jgi:hypothetical protein
MVPSYQFLCSELVTATYDQRPGEMCQAIANLEEISAGAAVVLLEEKPRLGAPISLNTQGHDVFGVIASRDYDETLGWFTTVIFDAASEWSPELFAPDHLLDMSAGSGEAATQSKVRTLGNGLSPEQNLPVDFFLYVA